MATPDRRLLTNTLESLRDAVTNLREGVEPGIVANDLALLFMHIEAERGTDIPVIVCERCGRDGLLRVVHDGEGRVIGGDVKPDPMRYERELRARLRSLVHREEIEDEVLRGEHRDD